MYRDNETRWVASLPSGVLQWKTRGSSDPRIMTVAGTSASHSPRLFWNSQVPSPPSLNDTVTGTIASFVNVAQPAIVDSPGSRGPVSRPPAMLHVDVVVTGAGENSVRLRFRGSGSQFSSVNFETLSSLDRAR